MAAQAETIHTLLTAVQALGQQSPHLMTDSDRKSRREVQEKLEASKKCQTGLEEKMVGLQKELEDTQKGKQELVKLLEDADECTDNLKASRDELQKMLEEKEKRLWELQAEKVRLQKQLEDAKNSKQSLQAERLQGELEALKKWSKWWERMGGGRSIPCGK